MGDTYRVKQIQSGSNKYNLLNAARFKLYFFEKLEK